MSKNPPQKNPANRASAQKQSSVSCAQQRTPDNDNWWRGAVVYQIYPRSFADSNADGIGDLNGITGRLEHVAELGANAVWLSPFFKSPMADFGYDVSNYRDVDPLFGNLADFDRLLEKANRLGLKVLIDQVLSHSSSAHKWFAQSRNARTGERANWYVWSDPKADGSPPNNWLSVFGGPAWNWEPRRRQYYLHNFLESQPDLNFHEHQVREEMLDILRFWLDRGVAGFRLDTVNYFYHDALLRDNPPATDRCLDSFDGNPYGMQKHIHDKSRPENLEFMEQIGALLALYPGSTAIGEIGAGAESLALMAEYTAPGRLPMCYTFDLLSGPLSAQTISQAVGNFESLAGKGWPCWSFSNHDVTRHLTRWNVPDEFCAAAARLAPALLGCLRGTMCIYQGEELGLPEAELEKADLRDPYGIRFWPDFKGRDGCRTPMPWNTAETHAGFSSAKPWLPVPSAHKLIAADSQRGQENSVFAEYRRFIALRKSEPALQTGTFELLDSPDDCLMLRRVHSGRKLLCAFNLSHKHARLTVSGKGNANRLLATFGAGGRIIGREIKLPPFGCAVCVEH